MPVGADRYPFDRVGVAGQPGDVRIGARAEQTAASVRSGGKSVRSQGELGGQRETLWFNTLRDTPLKDVRVRKAISLAIDKREGIQAVESGNAFLSTLQNPKSPWPNPDWMSWPGYKEGGRDADRAEAKRLLADAGLPNGFETTLFGQRTWQAEEEWIQAQLATVGIKVTLDLVDVATYNERAARKDFNLQTGKGATITLIGPLDSLRTIAEPGVNSVIVPAPVVVVVLVVVVDVCAKASGATAASAMLSSVVFIVPFVPLNR